MFLLPMFLVAVVIITIFFSIATHGKMNKSVLRTLYKTQKSLSILKTEWFYFQSTCSFGKTMFKMSKLCNFSNKRRNLETHPVFLNFDFKSK